MPHLDAFGTISGPSWGHLGAILGHLGAILGPTWAILGPSWGHLGPSWAILGPNMAPYEKRQHTRVRVHMGTCAFVFRLGPSWGHLRRHARMRAHMRTHMIPRRPQEGSRRQLSQHVRMCTLTPDALRPEKGERKSKRLSTAQAPGAPRARGIILFKKHPNRPQRI